MSHLSFDQVVDAAMNLQPELRTALVQLLQVSPTPGANDEYLNDEYFEETEALREAGAFEVVAPLPDSHGHLDLIAEADLLAAIQSMATGWEDDPLL